MAANHADTLRALRIGVKADPAYPNRRTAVAALDAAIAALSAPEASGADSFVMVESAVRSLPSGYAFADAVEHATHADESGAFNALADDEAERQQYERDKLDPSNCLTTPTAESGAAGQAPMTYTQRVDVEKVQKFVPAHSGGGMVAVITNAPEHTYIKWTDCAALLQQVAAQAAEIERLRETLVRVTNPDGSPNLQAEQVGAAESYRAAAIHAIDRAEAAERAKEEAMSRLRTIHDEHNNPDGAGVHWGTWESLGSFLASLPPEQEGPEGEDGPWADGWEERSKTTGGGG